MAPYLADAAPGATGLAHQSRAAAGAAVRAAAARAVHAVRANGRSLNDALPGEQAGLGERDRALLQALAFGTLRLLPRLDALSALLLSRDLRPGDVVLKDLLAVGLYQLVATRIPERAAVAATVEAVRILERPRAAALINAILRRFQRERSDLLAEVERDPCAHWLFPHWLLTRLQAAWPEDWQHIVAVSNEQAPMTLRVNPLRTDRSRYLARLADAGLAARPLPDHAQGVALERPIATARLPGFADGLVSVQDASAQFAAELLDPRPGETVLDACAAPGGKTAHLIEHSRAGARITAADRDRTRLQALRQNLQRLGLSADVLSADATDAAADWPGAPYCRILIDAPCSATGVIRRHPDIKWLRRETDIPALVETQRRMLEALWPLLRPGGRLVYATCSMLPDENEEQVRAFLERHGDALERTVESLLQARARGGVTRRPGLQLLPTSGGGDGFYYAVLEKAG
jgi:16S rRNA (cytosine967-C5)-methyltransferase